MENIEVNGMTPEDMIRNLNYVYNKFKNQKTYTGDIVISDMILDCKHMIEKLNNVIITLQETTDKNTNSMFNDYLSNR